MIIDTSRLFVDESRSNPMDVCLMYPECPLKDNRPCGYVAIGFGNTSGSCEFLKEVGKEVSCSYGEQL